MVELPEFDVLFALSDEIYELSVRKAVLENRIKFEESLVVRNAVSDPKYFKDGKPAAMNFIEAAYKYTGLNNEIIPLRDELIEVKALLDQKQIVLDLFKVQIEVWKSQNYNERKLTL